MEHKHAFDTYGICSCGFDINTDLSIPKRFDMTAKSINRNEIRLKELFDSVASGECDQDAYLSRVTEIIKKSYQAGYSRGYARKHLNHQSKEILVCSICEQVVDFVDSSDLIK